MGLVAIGTALLTRGAAALGIGGGGAAAGGAGAAARGILGRLFGNPIVQGAGGAAAFAGGSALLAPGAAITPTAIGAAGAAGARGRAGFVTLEDGSMILVSASGVPARANLFLPAGAKLPSGAMVVSVSPNGQLFGIRKKRVKKTFAAEVAKVKDTVKNAKELLDICGKAVKK